MARSQKMIHRKDELTWPAHILTCLPHFLSHVLTLNGTSLNAITTNAPPTSVMEKMAYFGCSASSSLIQVGNSAALSILQYDGSVNARMV